MAYETTSGTKLFIGAAISDKNGDFVAADFTSQTWVEVDGLTNLGSAGDTSQAVTTSLINRGRDLVQKGTRNAGTMEVVAAINAADPGQIALIAAEKSRSDFAFKMELSDAPAGGTASQRLFIAKVMSASEALNEANNVIELNASLAINSNIVRVNASDD